MARNQWEDALQAVLTGGLEGYQAGNAGQKEIENTLMLEKLKTAIKQDASGNIKPTPGMRLKREKMNQYGIMEREYEPVITTPKPSYKVVGGKVLELPAVSGGQPTVAYEDPDKIKARQNVSENIIKNAQDMLGTVQTVRKGKRFFGRAGGLPSLITAGFNDEEYSARSQWEAETNKLLAQRMMEKMMELKAASKSGSTGFGQLTEREGRKIQEASTALNRTLSPEVAEQYLAVMEDSLNKIIEGARRENLGENIGYSIGEEVPSSILKPLVSTPVNSSSSMKAVRANQLRKQYPNLSKKQIIDMVNKEF